jgi:hypothetical protein
MEIARTIQSQLGILALRMLGAKDYMAVENGLQLTIRGSRKVNRIQVILDHGSDTYMVKFLKVIMGKNPRCNTVSEHKGIYVDMLHDLIEKETGLYTSL